MAHLKIDTFIGDTAETTIKIPLVAFQIVAGFIPQKIGDALETKGFNLRELLEAAKSAQAHGVLIDIFEHETCERVVISVE